jgi:hypothetical protein
VFTTPTAKQCYHCQGLGHVQADCPTLRLNGGANSGRCYNCNQIGHLAVSLLHPGTESVADIRFSETAQLPECKVACGMSLALAEGLMHPSVAALRGGILGRRLVTNAVARIILLEIVKPRP